MGRRGGCGRCAAVDARRRRPPFAPWGAGAATTAVRRAATPWAQQLGEAGVRRGDAQGLVGGVGVGAVTRAVNGDADTTAHSELRVQGVVEKTVLERTRSLLFTRWAAPKFV